MTIKKKKKKRKCALPGCFVMFMPEHATHYFHHFNCHNEARILYGCASQIKGEHDHRLIADLAANRWQPLLTRSRRNHELQSVARW